MRPLILALLLLLLVPASTLALDCTPDFNWTCASNGFFDYLVGQPGEVICGVDYTGWTLNVVNVTVTTGGWVAMAAVSAASASPGTWVDSAIILMDDCGAGTCVTSTQSTGVTQLNVCVEPGVHTFIIASHTTAPGAVVNFSPACFTCEQADGNGFGPCAACGAVSTEPESWGSLKSRFN
jgi:hypothetical protein